MVYAGHVADPPRVRPERHDRVAPDDLVADDVRLGIGVPAQLRVIREVGRDHASVDRRPRRPGEGGQRRADDARGALEVVEVDEPQQVAELRAVLDADVLVLVVVVLVRLGEPHRRPALLEEGDLVAASQEAVAAPYELDPHAGGAVLAGLLDVARELARDPVVLPADRLAARRLLRRLARRHALREDADRARIAHAVAADRVADDVHVQDALDVPVVLPRELGEVGGAVEPLLLAGERDEDDRRLGRTRSEDTRELDHRRGARPVVVGAGRVARRVEHVGDARVVVGADHVHPVRRRRIRAPERRHDVRDARRHRDARRGLLDVALQLDGHAAVRGGCDLRELVADPVARGADPAVRVVLAGERVARPEAHERAVVPLEAPGVDPPELRPDIPRRRPPARRAVAAVAVAHSGADDGERDGARHSSAHQHERGETKSMHG